MSSGPNGRPQTKKAAAELLPHIMDLQTESWSHSGPPRCLMCTSSAEAFSQWQLNHHHFYTFLKQTSDYVPEEFRSGEPQRSQTHRQQCKNDHRAFFNLNVKRFHRVQKTVTCRPLHNSLGWRLSPPKSTAYARQTIIIPQRRIVCVQSGLKPSGCKCVCSSLMQVCGSKSRRLSWSRLQMVGHMNDSAAEPSKSITGLHKTPKRQSWFTS